MLINLKSFLDSNQIPAQGIIHVGAHYGQEYDHYVQCGFDKIIFIEPQKKVFDILQWKFDGVPGVEVYNFACGSRPDHLEMYVENVNEGQSSSLMKPVVHLLQHPEIQFNAKETVQVFPLDFLNHVGNNVLMMDVQGYEMQVLLGARQCLKHIDVVYSEVNRAEMYEGCPMIEELDFWLLQYGFERRETKWAHENLGWGDAIFLKTK